MDGIAQATSAERAELFRSSAAVLRPERSPAIIEKDFWVCWTLHRTYEVLQFRPELVFKGGTSLSKAYNAIQRFSEDVDLSLSRRDLGFADNRDPEEEGISRRESKRRIDALVVACQAVIHDRLLPELRADFTSVIGAEGWSVDLDVSDPQTLIFTYPRSEPRATIPEAIRPAIRLEMGARSDDWPTEEREIRPYAAEAFPAAFETRASCRAHVLDAKRTFWEKATLLHAEFHRPADRTTADGLSRHYYDIQTVRFPDSRDSHGCILSPDGCESRCNTVAKKGTSNSRNPPTAQSYTPLTCRFPARLTGSRGHMLIFAGAKTDLRTC